MATRKVVQPALADKSDAELVQAALKVLERQARYGEKVNSPDAARDYFRLQLGTLEYEAFACAWLDSQHRVIAFETLFVGTLSQTSVYPREVVKAALRHNAAAVIFAHNHPSGAVEPSRADECLTTALKSALALVDIRVIDHFVVTAGGSCSFAERGLL